MKRITILLLTVMLCLAACGKKTEPEYTTQEPHTQAADEESTAQTSQLESSGKELTPESPAVELAGPWHLDEGKNDLAAFADSIDLFPGYVEWGAGMEIRSDGQMSWYIGAESWHGTYIVENGVVHAHLTSDLEQSEKNWDFRVTTENGTAELEMEYGDITICWAYGDRQDASAMGEDPIVYGDRQGTADPYSSLSVTKTENGYAIEMNIYRQGYFCGTAVEAQGVFLYTDDTLDMQGILKQDADHAVFEVTESSAEQAPVGSVWVFQKRV